MAIAALLLARCGQHTTKGGIQAGGFRCNPVQPISPGCYSNNRRSIEPELSHWIRDSRANEAAIRGLPRALFFVKEVIGLSPVSPVKPVTSEGVPHTVIGLHYGSRDRGRDTHPVAALVLVAV